MGQVKHRAYQNAGQYSGVGKIVEQDDGQQDKRAIAGELAVFEGRGGERRFSSTCEPSRGAAAGD